VRPTSLQVDRSPGPPPLVLFAGVASAIVLGLHSITRFHIGSPRGVVPMSLVDGSSWPGWALLRYVTTIVPASLQGGSRWIEQTYSSVPATPGENISEVSSPAIAYGTKNSLSIDPSAFFRPGQWG